MMSRLLRRIKELEKRTPEPSAIRRSIVPEWLLQGWLGQGLQFDSTDDASVLRALRALECGTATNQPSLVPSNQDSRL
jgi:hypothetical protein